MVTFNLYFIIFPLNMKFYCNTNIYQFSLIISASISYAITLTMYSSENITTKLCSSSTTIVSSVIRISSAKSQSISLLSLPTYYLLRRSFYNGSPSAIIASRRFTRSSLSFATLSQAIKKDLYSVFSIVCGQLLSLAPLIAIISSTQNNIKQHAFLACCRVMVRLFSY